jgi:hypothetical protein
MATRATTTVAPAVIGAARTTSLDFLLLTGFSGRLPFEKILPCVRPNQQQLLCPALRWPAV